VQVGHTRRKQSAGAPASRPPHESGRPRDGLVQSHRSWLVQSLYNGIGLDVDAVVAQVLKTANVKRTQEPFDVTISKRSVATEGARVYTLEANSTTVSVSSTWLESISEPVPPDITVSTWRGCDAIPEYRFLLSCSYWRPAGSLGQAGNKDATGKRCWKGERQSSRDSTPKRTPFCSLCPDQ
jgi:hypothetical protein